MICGEFSMPNENDFDIPGQIQSDMVSVYDDYHAFIETLKSIPSKTLQAHGLLDSLHDSKRIAELYSHRVQSNGQLFRKNKAADDQLVLVWQSKVLLDAVSNFTSGKLKKYQGIDEDHLKHLVQLSIDSENIKNMPALLSKFGIILIYQPALAGMRLDGSVTVLPSGNPVIGMSFRYSRVDNFWFTLMHELAHIYLHYDQLEKPILDSFDDIDSQAEDIEIQANRFSKFTLVNKVSWRNCKPKYTKKESDVLEYANQIGVHPAIVAGLLQREMRDYTIFRSIVDATDVRELVFGNV